MHADSIATNSQAYAQVQVHIPEAQVLALTTFVTAETTKPEDAVVVRDFLIRAHEFQATVDITAVRCDNLTCATVQPPGVRYRKCSGCITAQDCPRYCSRACSVMAWRGGHKSLCAAAADASSTSACESESHAVATLRRLVTLYLPSARDKMLAGGDVAGTHVLWLDAHSTPCTLTLTPSSHTRQQLRMRLADAAANDTVLTLEIAAANAVLTAFEMALAAARVTEIAVFEPYNVHMPVVMSTPLGFLCLPDAGKWQVLMLEGSRFNAIHDRCGAQHASDRAGGSCCCASRRCHGGVDQY